MTSIAIVSLRTTLGLANADDQLARDLRRLGYRVHVIAADLDHYRRKWRRFAHVPPFRDLMEALALRRATTALAAAENPDWFVYTTTTACLLEPPRRRRRGVLRFDSLAMQNRRGLRNSVLWVLELCSLMLVRQLWPVTDLKLCSARLRKKTYVVPIRPEPLNGEPPRRSWAGPLTVAAFVNGPKKQPELLINAWLIAHRSLPMATLLVAGCTEAQLLDLLAPGSSVPSSVQCVGILAEPDFRQLLASCEAYIAAPVVEEFGIAPLQALAAGCLLVTTPSPGSYVARRVVESVEPRLVARSYEATDLAQSLVWSLTQDRDQTRRLRLNLAAQLRNLTDGLPSDELNRALAALTAIRH